VRGKGVGNFHERARIPPAPDKNRGGASTAQAWLDWPHASGVALALLVCRSTGTRAPSDACRSGARDVIDASAKPRRTAATLGSASPFALGHASLRRSDGWTLTLDEEEARQVARHAGATHISPGSLRAGEQGKMPHAQGLRSRRGRDRPRARPRRRSGEAPAFQEVLERATAQVLERSGGSRDKRPGARGTESFAAFLASSGARRLYSRGPSRSPRRDREGPEARPALRRPFEVATT